MEDFNVNLKSKVEEAIAFIKQHNKMVPEIAIILGTGLGGLVDEINVETVIDYGEIPHFPVSTVESHKGKLIFGTLSGKKVIAMQGRFHYYEGYSMQKLTFPVRVMKMLGAGTLIISNACGTLNPYIPKGSIMLIDDHINLLGDNPLIGKHDDFWGPRFVDMSEPYSKELMRKAEATAVELGIKIYKGVFSAMTGPSLETRAEYRFLRKIGADVIGMSTIPENIVANQMGMKVIGFSITTDECYPDALKPVNLDEMIATANSTEPKLTKIIKEMIKKL